MKKILALILISAASTGILSAQSVLSLEVNPDARSQAMGGVTVTQTASAFSFFNNTSNTILGKETWQAGVSYGMWGKDQMISAGGYARVAKIVAVSAGVKYYAFPSFEYSPDGYGAKMATASPKDMSAGVGVAVKVVKFLSLSANVSYYTSALDVEGASKASGVSADFGATFQFSKLRAGLTVANIGSKVNYGGTSSWNLPANARIGVGGTVGSENHSVAIDGQVGMLFEGSSFFASAGVDYTIHKIVSIRAGYHYGDQAKFVPSYASAGIGVKIAMVRIAGSYLFASGDSPLKNTFCASVSVGF